MSAKEIKPGGEVILYQTEDLQTRVQVRLDGQTAWLSLKRPVAGICLVGRLDTALTQISACLMSDTTLTQTQSTTQNDTLFSTRICL